MYVECATAATAKRSFDVNRRHKLTTNTTKVQHLKIRLLHCPATGKDSCEDPDKGGVST